MGYGKRGIAPCGHEGEAVIGQYYECPTCDHPNFKIVLKAPRCARCNSTDIDLEFDLGPVFYFFNPDSEIIDTRCNNCGSVWTR